MIKKSYLIRWGIQLVFLWIFTGNAWAVCWVALDGGTEKNSFVDMCSIVTVGQYKKAWMKFEFSQIQKNMKDNGHDYVKMLSLYYFDCDGKRFGMVNSNFYANDNSLVDSFKLNIGDVEMTDVAPESIGDTLMTYVCLVGDLSNKGVKKQPSNDSDIFSDTPPVKKTIKPKVPNKIM
ncbi:MAG: hypothetical protein K2Q15_07190 [Burkholderiales bacterium]|nr:hypothetical protein [Burkholderiales bacterium]